MKAVGHADRLPFYGAITGEILGLEAARLTWVVLHRVGDVAGDGAPVESIGPVTGNRLEGLGEHGVLEPVAGRQRPSARVEEIGARFAR